MSRLTRIALAATAAGLLLVVAACAWQGLQSSDTGARRLYIVGKLEHLDDAQVTAALRPYLRMSYFDLPVSAARDTLAELPWVAAASVHRRWPDGVVVRLREHHAVARWGDDALLAADGSIFKVPADQRPAGLVRLSGPPDSAARLQRQLQQLQAVLTPADRHIAALQLNARGAWQATLADGLALRLGRAGCVDRLQRFVSHLTPALKRRLEDAGYVDLRYADGFAVGGQPAHAEQTASGESHHDEKA